MAGVDPVLPEQKEKKPFENVCPQCQNNKAMARPASSFRGGRQQADFLIKKNAGPMALKQRR